MPATYTDRLDGLTASVAVKAPCRVATTANITLSGLQTIDGVTLVANDRVLVTSQTDASENGIWLAQAGAWSRALDFNGLRDVVGGTQIYVTSGTVNAGTIWRVAGTGTYSIGADDIDLDIALNPSSFPIIPEQFGALASGVDDSAAIEDAAAAAVSRKAVLKFSPGKVYTFSQVAFPANCVVEMRGATLRSDGSLTTAGDITVTVGDGCSFDELNITTPGTETNTDILELGANVRIGVLDIRSDAQRAGGGIITEGDNVTIERLVTRKIDRPLHLANTSITTLNEGSYIGYLDIEDYVRGFRADFCSFDVGDSYMRGRSANASKSAGHNGILILGCQDFSFGDQWIEDAGEHAVRIGGSLGTYTETRNYRFGVITAIRPGGCAFKVNPTLLVSAGVTEKAYNGTVAGVVGTDVGEATVEGNEELMRLTHVVGLTIGFARSFVDQQAASSQYAVQINDANGVTIGELESATANAGFVNILGTSDVDGVDFFGGDVVALRIGRLIGITTGANAIGVNTAFNVGRVHIGLDGIRGFSSNVISWSGTLTDDFELKGWVGGSVAPVYSGVPDSDEFVVDVRYNNTRAIGRGARVRSAGGVVELAAPSFDPADSDAGATGFFLTNGSGTAGAGNHGSAVEGTGPGTQRRGWSLGGFQPTADPLKVAPALYYKNVVSSSNEALSPGAFVYGGGLYIPDAAPDVPDTVAGWMVIYIDPADNDLKVKFGDGTVKTLATDT